jgi:hypothetical protein
MDKDLRISAELSVLIKATLRGDENLSLFGRSVSSPDSGRLSQLSRYHQVQSLLYDYATDHENVVNEKDLEEVKVHSINEAVYNMIFLRKSLELNAALSENGVDAFLMKGAFWAWWLYERPGLREFGDIDYFLKKQHITKGLGVLGLHGFEPDSYRKFLLEDEKVSQLYFQTDYQLPLVPNAESVVKSLEIQWNSSYPRFAYSFSWDELMSGSMIFEVFDQKITVPSVDNQLLMMLVHHVGVEQWDKLKYMGDFVRLLRKFSDQIDWPYVVGVARDKGFYRLLLESLGLVRVLTGDDYAKHISDDQLSEYPSDGLSSAVFAHWENKRAKPMTKSWRIFYFNIKYRDRPSDKLRILFRHLMYFVEWRLLIPKARWYYRNRR